METPSEKTDKSAKQPSRKALTAKLVELNQEYRDLGIEAGSGNSAALARRSEIARELRAISATLHLREKDVEIMVPRSVTGHPFRLGEAEFQPGRHVVKESIAQYLLWMIDTNRANELKRLQANGHEVDLGNIGEKATQIEREF